MPRFLAFFLCAAIVVDEHRDAALPTQSGQVLAEHVGCCGHLIGAKRRRIALEAIDHHVERHG